MHSVLWEVSGHGVMIRSGPRQSDSSVLGGELAME